MTDLSPTFRAYYAPNGEWLVSSDELDGKTVANYGKGDKACSKAFRHARMANRRIERLADPTTNSTTGTTPSLAS